MNGPPSPGSSRIENIITSPNSSLNSLKGKQPETEATRATAEKLRHAEHHIMRLNAALADAEQQLAMLRLERSGSKTVETAEDATVLQSLTKRLQDLNEAIDDLAFPIVQSFPDIPLTRTLVDAFMVCRPQSGELFTSLADFHLKTDCNGTVQDFLHPMIQTLILSVIFHNIMGPFAPGLSRAESDNLKAVYRQIANKEPQDRSARWRSMTYLHANASRDDQALAERLAHECIGILQDTLVPFSPGVDNTYDLGQAASLLPTIFNDAIKWQDTAKSSCLSHDFEAFLPTIGDNYNSALMHTYPQPSENRGRVVSLNGLGMRSWRNMRRADQSIGKERKVIWKASVTIDHTKA